MWKPVELIADYWIIIDDDGGYYEYCDEHGDNLMFITKNQAQEKVDQINAVVKIDKEFFNQITNNLLDRNL